MAGFITQLQVPYAHTDMAGIVHFSEFFKYMENAEHAWFRSVGLSVNRDQPGQHLSWPRVKASFDYAKPLHFEDIIEIEITVERLGGKSVTFRADVMKEKKIMATGHSTSVCCEMTDSGIKSVEIPAAFRKHFQTIQRRAE
jgi:acyl-CoA thioester hydrolase